MDLFDDAPAPVPGKPTPWSSAPGFTASDAWRDYCEAWGEVIAERRQEVTLGMSAVQKHRGKAGVDRLERHKHIVKDDLAGRVTPRNRLFSLMQ
jgi:hypothetical protein